MIEGQSGRLSSQSVYHIIHIHLISYGLVSSISRIEKSSPAKMITRFHGGERYRHVQLPVESFIIRGQKWDTGYTLSTFSSLSSSPFSSNYSLHNTISHGPISPSICRRPSSRCNRCHFKRACKAPGQESR